METNNNQLSKSELEKAEKEYPGAAINTADDNSDCEKLVDERTKTLNNNPRNESKPV